LPTLSKSSPSKTARSPLPIVESAIKLHVEKLKRCKLCPEMIQPVVTGTPVASKVMLVGQAPGDKEGGFGKPFAWTAGKTLFKWFAQLGLSEEEFRSSVYMAAVCRCFPGKNPKGGDRVPDEGEIENCSSWMAKEIEILKPSLVIPVGKLAIAQFVKHSKLNEVVGTTHSLNFKLPNSTSTIPLDVIPLPHPSGASTWHRMEPGITLLKKSLRLIEAHPAFETLVERAQKNSTKKKVQNDH
jgi:uracil-DNA glycosylase